MKRILLASIAFGALSFVAVAQTAGDQALPKGFKTTPLVKSGMTASNMKVAYAVGGDAEITAVIGELEAGGRTARHQHPVPVVVYVLEGTITLQADGGPPREYKPGQAYIEDINHWHQAFNNTASLTKILVVFAGVQGKPTTINAQ